MKRTLSALFLIALAGQAFAWSKQGHQLVGELAERELSPTARDQVQRLLAGEPEPTLAGVSTWADEIRAQSRTPAGNTLGELSSRWHYVNFPGEGCDYVPARDCPDGNCVIGAINAQAAILRDRSRSDEERRNALKFLVHFVGDAHQPMHAGFGHDRGGNNFQVNYRGKALPEGQGTNLHGVWDYWLLQSAGLDNPAYIEKLLQSPVPADPAPATHQYITVYDNGDRGGFAGVGVLSGRLDEFVDVLGLFLQDALSLHLVAVHQVIDQSRRVIFAARGDPIYRFGHHLDERHRRQPVERILDDTTVVPLALGQLGFDLVERTHFRKTGYGAILVDVAQDVLGA